MKSSLLLAALITPLLTAGCYGMIPPRIMAERAYDRQDYNSCLSHVERQRSSGIWPDSDDLLMVEGRCHEGARQDELAIRSYRRLLANYPSSPLATAAKSRLSVVEERKRANDTAVLEQAARKKREEEAREQANEARRKAVRDKVPCRFAMFYGYAADYYEASEVTTDRKQMFKLASIYPLACSNGGNGMCRGFYFGHQLVEVGLPLDEDSDLITIAVKVDFTIGAKTVYLFTHPDYLTCQ